MRRWLRDSGLTIALLALFESWQSEFLSTAVLILLAIVLRERGSPESKAVGDPHSKTGE